MMKKIDAFTLLEVTIAMLLSAICIGICYTAFTLTQQYYSTLKQRKDDIGNFLQLKQLFTNDFRKAIKITRTENGLMIENETGTINYQLTPVDVLRDQYQIKTDTIRIGVSEVQFKFEKATAETDALVDEFSFSCKLKDKQTSMHFEKTYSSTNLFR